MGGVVKDVTSVRSRALSCSNLSLLMIHPRTFSIPGLSVDYQDDFSLSCLFSRLGGIGGEILCFWWRSQNHQRSDKDGEGHS